LRRETGGSERTVSSIRDIAAMLRSIAREYPPALVSKQLRDIDRIAYYVSLVSSRHGRNARVCDIGAGFGLFSLGCAALGMSSTMVDDFQDDDIRNNCGKFLELHRRYGVTAIRRDVIAMGVEFPPNSFDVVTAFETMEHWHHSPKSLFQQLLLSLKPGGSFILGVPNCVDLWKRITVPLGRAKWSSINDWYEREVFGGHVREANVADLRYIARDLSLVNTSRENNGAE